MSFTDFLPGIRRTVSWDALRDSQGLRAAMVGSVHVGALVVLWLTEASWFGAALFVLTWGMLNAFWLVLLRRPGVSAALSLLFILVLIELSLFKAAMIWTTISFFDFLIIDADTVAFLLMVFPELRNVIVAAAAVAMPLLAAVWWLDPFRVPRAAAALLGGGCLASAIAMSLAVPEQPWEPFQHVNHVSNFTRSGVLSVSELSMKGWIEADGPSPERFRLAADEACAPQGKLPHIILVLDEASFDITAAPGIKVPPGYERHFQSFDGKTRSFVVEGSGGPTWYTEYNVLTGLSARSYGRLKFYVTRIAAGRVERGLPHALRRCGYRTFSLYPAYGAFLSARRFQKSAGVDRLIDLNEMGGEFVEPDSYYYDQALQLLARERDGKPKFVFVYTVANHFPWDEQWAPELTPGWTGLGNAPDVDEYIRRQTISARDYQQFVDQLKRRFPDEAFLIVRFGDHQPVLSQRILDPWARNDAVGRALMSHDLRYFTTYYAIDAVNFRPVDLSSALDRLEAPYLPLVVQEAAGVPLDATFAEQKRILDRCKGQFYHCGGGVEARRFNRLLIDAGLIKGMVSR